ncbi:MAG: tetratricopeptide repeat protein [Nitrospirae bacterium]|nr:tetratricopeptide repeat protein [Nitrospirota bacterium]
MMRFCSGLFLAIGLLWLAGCFAGPGGPLGRGPSAHSAELTEGLRAFKNAEYEKAKRLLNVVDLRTGSPEREEARWHLARIAERQGSRSEAVQRYVAFLREYPSSRHREEAKGWLVVLRRPPPTGVISAGLVDPGQAGLSNGMRGGMGAGIIVPVSDTGTSIQPATPGNSMGSANQGGNQTDVAKPAAQEPAAAPLRVRAEKPRYALTGSLMTEYLFDQLVTPSPTETLQNRLGEYLNLRWKNLSGPDIRLYFYGMYSHDFLPQANDFYRVYKLFAEWNDLGSLLSFRVGRQPGSGNTLFSRFDGVTLTVRPSPLFSVSVGGGFPVSTFTSDRLGMQTGRRFYEIYATVYDWYHVGGKLYYTQELDQNFSARRAVGFNGYWTRDTVNLSAIMDYDIDFARLNDLSLGADHTWGPVHYSVGAEYRKNPLLDASSARLDPNACGLEAPGTPLGDLGQYPRSAIQSCALKNTADMLEFRGSVSVEFSKVWRGELRYAHLTGTMVNFTTTGGVTTVGQIDRRSDRASLFVSERNGLHLAEMWTLLLLAEPATEYQTFSLYTTLSRSWGERLQGALRFRADQYNYKTINVRTSRLAPGFVLTYTLPSGVSANLETDYAIEGSGVTSDSVQARATLTIPF